MWLVLQTLHLIHPLGHSQLPEPADFLTPVSRWFSYAHYFSCRPLACFNFKKPWKTSMRTHEWLLSSTVSSQSSLMLSYPCPHVFWFLWVHNLQVCELFAFTPETLFLHSGSTETMRGGSKEQLLRVISVIIWVTCPRWDLTGLWKGKRLPSSIEVMALLLPVQRVQGNVWFKTVRLSGPNQTLSLTPA